MADKKNSRKKEDMVKVNLAEIDRKRREYRWGMESFFRNSEIEAENYKEALETYRKSCLVFMSEKDIKKIENTKKIKVKRIPFINLYKIRKEKPLGRWMASACFKNCEISENRYKKELEDYNQACRMQVKPEEMAVIAKELQCGIPEFAFSNEIVDLSEIRRRLGRMEETELKELFAEDKSAIHKYEPEILKQNRWLNMNFAEVKGIENKLQWDKTEFSELINSEYRVNLLEVKRKIEENILNKFLVKCKMDTDEYNQAILLYEKSGFIKAETVDIKKISKKLRIEKEKFTKNAVDLSAIQSQWEEQEPENIEKILADCEIKIQNYAEELEDYKEASYLTMKEDDIEKLAKGLQCKKEEIEIKQNKVNLLQIEEKKEKIAREKWDTLESFFESCRVKNDYGKEINRYESQDFIECKLNWIDKITDGIISNSRGDWNGDWKDLLYKDEIKYIKERIDKSESYNKISEETNLKNIAKNFGCTLEELSEKLGKEKYKVKAVELERKQKYIHERDWKDGNISATLSNLLKDELRTDDKKLLEAQSKKFKRDREVDIEKEDCEKIADALTCNINDIKGGKTYWDFRKTPELWGDEVSVLSMANSSHIEQSAISGKKREAKKKQRITCKIERSVLARIASSEQCRVEDLEALEIDIVKDSIREELAGYSAQIKREILQELLEEESNRIEYIETETGYDIVIYFKGEKYDIEDISELQDDEDIVQHLITEIGEELSQRADEIPEDVYENFHLLPMERIGESKEQLSAENYPFFLEKCKQLLKRMDDDGKIWGEQQKALRNETAQDVCDYYEIPNPFDIEE